MNANGDRLAVPRLDLRCLLSFEFPKRRKRRSSCNPPPPQVNSTQTVPLAERDMVEACHVQEGGAGSTATRPRAVHFGAERSGATRSAPGRTGCQLDLVALPLVRDLLLCAKHLFLLPWWLAARSPRQGAGSTLPRMRMPWPPSPSISHGAPCRAKRCYRPPIGVVLGGDACDGGTSWRVRRPQQPWALLGGPYMLRSMLGRRSPNASRWSTRA